jgi:phenylacetate-CoA ligase
VEGYPSYLHLLALHLKRIGRTLPVHAVFPYSEPTYDHQRRLIEERFQCKVFDWYGLAERVASAGQCERTDGYHVSAEKTIIEIVKPGGEHAAPGEQGEIVGTNLDEYGMPLIRYRTGDRSAYLAEPCPCGRGLPLIKQVQEHQEDLITTPDGRLIWGVADFLSVLRDGMRLGSVDRTQIIQDAVDRVVIKVVPTELYSQVDHDRIIGGFSAILGPEVNISIELVDEIPRTPSGKYRFVISKVPVEV